MKIKNKSKKRLIQIIEVLKFHNLVHGVTPQKFRAILEDLGPTFVKLGQIMSMRPDLIPLEYTNELISLRSEVTPMEFVQILEIISSEYNIGSYHEIFSYIDPKPIGSASIAQVHYAILINGDPVVIKVQRPGIWDIMYNDIKILKKALVIIKLRPNLGNPIDYKTILEELWISTQQELDFLVEAAHLNEFKLQNSEIKYISCPTVYNNLSTSQILVMEYIDGIEISNEYELIGKGYDLKDISLKLAENYSKQILDDGFFHADPHPGNILIKDGKIVWLDLGMIGRLSERERGLLTEAVLAIKTEDVYQLKKVVLSLGIIRKNINHSQLFADLDLALNRYASLDFSHMNLGLIISDLMNIAIRNNVGMPPGITMLSRGLITMEGVLEKINPDLNFTDIVRTHMNTKKYNFKNEILSSYANLIYSMKKALDLPIYIADVMKMAAKGQAKINLELIGYEDPLKKVDKIIDKLVVTLICSALLISSSLISTTDMEIKILDIPAIGFIGFMISALLGLWLIVKLIKNAKE